MKNTQRKLPGLLLALFLLISMAFTAFAVEETLKQDEIVSDSAAPVIIHDPISYGRQGHSLLFQATVTDETAVTSVELFCRMDDSVQWRRIPMSYGKENTYTVQLDAAAMTMDRLEYYIQASDGTNVAVSEMQTVLVDDGMTIFALSTDQVTIAEATSTPVTVIGEGFSQEMIVTVGGTAASFTYVSETEIVLALPALNICKADLVIISGESSCTRLQAITYTDPLASVKVTAPAKVHVGQKVGFPISFYASASVTEVSMQIRLDPAYFSNIQFALETVNDNVVASCEVSSDGLMTLQLHSVESMAAEGPIGYLIAEIAYVPQEVKPVISIEQASMYGVEVHRLNCDVVISNAISIQLLHVPDQIYVLEGDLPDFHTWELEINYEGFTQRIPVTQDMITISQENPGQGKVTYFHKEVPFTFQILEKANTSLVIKTPASKCNYIVGEELDLTGLTLELSYQDGQFVLPVEEYTVTGFDGTTSGKQTIMLTAMGFETSMDVIVFQRGDINQDGKITLLDMVNVKSHILGMTKLDQVEALAADYNGDGKISILDYVQIKAVILGISADGE